MIKEDYPISILCNHTSHLTLDIPISTSEETRALVPWFLQNFHVLTFDRFLVRKRKAYNVLRWSRVVMEEEVIRSEVEGNTTSLPGLNIEEWTLAALRKDRNKGYLTATRTRVNGI